MSKRQNEIDLEAYHWVLQQERGPLSAEQQRLFDMWRAKDSRHEGAFHRAQAGILHLNRLAALAGGRNIFEAAPVNGARRKAIAAALSAVSLVGVGAWLGWGWLPGTRMRYATDVGQMRKVVLTDESEIVLNTTTEVFVRYTSGRRDIRLVGEALFTVAKEVARPFEVRVGEWLVKAVGTVFAVRGGDVDVVHVTVTEGMVEMRPAHSGATAEPRRVPANHEATVRASGVLEMQPISVEELRRQLAWRTGLVVFDGQPLHAAVLEMNRYSQHHLVVEDPTLAERRIVGVFTATDTDTFVSALQAKLGIRAISTGNVVLLRPGVSSD